MQLRAVANVETKLECVNKGYEKMVSLQAQVANDTIPKEHLIGTKHSCKTSA